MWWVVSPMPWLLHPQERNGVPILQGVGWASGLVWIGIENLAPTTVQIPNHPRVSFYSSYATWAPIKNSVINKFLIILT